MLEALNSSSSEANRKSQKLLPIQKIGEIYGDVPLIACILDVKKGNKYVTKFKAPKQ